MIVAGINLSISASTTITGLIYVLKPGSTISASHESRIEGAVVIENDNFELSGDLTLEYHNEILLAAQANVGPYVKVVGSWHDF